MMRTACAQKQIQLQKELRRALLDRAYDQKRQRQGPSAKQFHGRCAACGRQFYNGEEILEYTDDNGKIVARYHYYDEECRASAARREDDPGVNW